MSKELAREIYNHLKKTNQAFCFLQSTGEMVGIGTVKKILDIKD